MSIDGAEPLGTPMANDTPMASTSIVAVTSAWTSIPAGAVNVEPSTMACTTLPRSPPMALTATATPTDSVNDALCEPTLTPIVTPIVRAQIVGLPPAAPACWRRP